MRARLVNGWLKVRGFWSRTEDARNGIYAVIVVLALLSVVFFAHGSYQFGQSAEQSATAAKAEAQAARIQAHKSLVASNHHHAETVKQNEQMAFLLIYITQLLQTVHAAQLTNVGTIDAIKALETEVASVIEALPAADAQLINGAKGLESALMSLCVADHASCQPLPAVP